MVVGLTGVAALLLAAAAPRPALALIPYQPMAEPTALVHLHKAATYKRVPQPLVLPRPVAHPLQLPLPVAHPLLLPHPALLLLQLMVAGLVGLAALLPVAAAHRPALAPFPHPLMAEPTARVNLHKPATLKTVPQLRTPTLYRLLVTDVVRILGWDLKTAQTTV
jgi:hypothetical protein